MASEVINFQNETAEILKIRYVQGINIMSYKTPTPKIKYELASYYTHVLSSLYSIQSHSTLDSGKTISFRNGVGRSDNKMKAEAPETNNLANLTWKGCWGN